jgi:Txe/YoeB family toxin of Txe-Axe toxin-antitoxin module
MATGPGASTKNRLVYTVDCNGLIIVQARYHY